jgi:hypothetical protein
LAVESDLDAQVPPPKPSKKKKEKDELRDAVAAEKAKKKQNGVERTYETFITLQI